MTLNIPNYPQISWKQTKIGQTFVKSLAVMHVSVRYMWRTWKQCKKCKKYKKSFVLTNFHEAFEHALWHHIIYVTNYMPNDISHKVT